MPINSSFSPPPWLGGQPSAPMAPAGPDPLALYQYASQNMPGWMQGGDPMAYATYLQQNPNAPGMRRFMRQQGGLPNLGRDIPLYPGPPPPSGYGNDMRPQPVPGGPMAITGPPTMGGGPQPVRPMYMDPSYRPDPKNNWTPGPADWGGPTMDRWPQGGPPPQMGSPNDPRGPMFIDWRGGQPEVGPTTGDSGQGFQGTEDFGGQPTPLGRPLPPAFPGGSPRMGGGPLPMPPGGIRRRPSSPSGLFPQTPQPPGRRRPLRPGQGPPPTGPHSWPGTPPVDPYALPPQTPNPGAPPAPGRPPGFAPPPWLQIGGGNPRGR